MVVSSCFLRFFLFDVKILASLLPARLFSLSRDFQGIIIVITVNATLRRPGATTPLHTDHNPTHMYTQMFATCMSLPSKIGQSTRACVRVCFASVCHSKSSEGTSRRKRRLPLHRDFLGFLLCSRSGDHPWKPFFFYFLFGNCLMLLKWRSSIESSSGFFFFYNF